MSRRDVTATFSIVGPAWRRSCEIRVLRDQARELLEDLNNLFDKYDASNDPVGPPPAEGETCQCNTKEVACRHGWLRHRWVGLHG